ncbi:MAG: stage II sporulation protein P [Christensenellales bacterium]
MNRRTKAGNRRHTGEGYYLCLGALTAALILLLLGLVMKAMGNKNALQAVSMLPVQAAEADSASSGDTAFSALINPRAVLSAQIPALKGVYIAYTPEHDEEPLEENNKEEISEEIKIEILNLKNEDLNLTPIKGVTEPTILIYHTHTLEAYKQTDPPYEEKGAWRTEDETQSVVRVGSELASRLEAYGYSVIHDTTNHEPPKLSTSYDRSLETIEKYKKEYPSLRLFIDIHRDAYNTESTYHDVVQVDGKDIARVMMVVGTGERYDDSYVKPNWKENYKLALGITNALNAICDNFARDIRVKTGRYNQHISDMCLLIEVGHNANTLEEAINAIDYVGQCIDRVLSGSP